MKNAQKLIAIFLCVLLITGILPEVTKAETAEYLKILYASDGERFDDSASPKTTFAVQTGHSQRLKLDGEHGYVANIGKIATDPVVSGQVSRIDIDTTDDTNTHIVFEFDFCVAKAPASTRLYMIKRNSGSSQPKLFSFDATYFYSGTNLEKSFAYEVGKWYTISVETNLDKDYYSLSVIDGENVTPLATNVSETLDVASMRFAETSASHTDYFDVYIDNIRYYKMIEKPEGYIAPDVSITAEKSQYYYGETVNLTVSPQGTQLESTTVYVNDEEVGTYTDSSVNIPYTPAEPGTYTVKAVTKNTYGIEESKEISVTVNPNEAPGVSFVGIDSSVDFEESDDMILTAQADDDNGISKIELYVEGELKKTASAATLSYDFAQLQLDYGTYEVEAKAYDLCNLSASKKISVTLKPDGYILPTVTVSADSYSAVCGETVSLEVTADGSHFEKVDVYVDDTLYQSYTDKEFTVDISKLLDGDYKVKAVVKDTIGKETVDEKTVTFNLPDGYSSPTVSVSASQTNHKLGETAVATVTSGGTHWSLVEVYINGELYKP